MKQDGIFAPNEHEWAQIRGLHWTVVKLMMSSWVGTKKL